MSGLFLTGGKKKRYKTQHCKTFRQHGHCPYGARCKFIHSDHSDDAAASAPGQLEQRRSSPGDASISSLRNRRSQSLDSGPGASGTSGATSGGTASSSGGPGTARKHSGDISPLGQMSPFQDLSPRSPEIQRRLSPRGGGGQSPRGGGQRSLSVAAEGEAPRGLRGHAAVVVSSHEDDSVRFVKKEKDRLPIFKVIAGGANPQ